MTSATSWHITSSSDGEDAPECDAVREWLREYNWQANPEFMRKWHAPEHDARLLVLAARAGDVVIGGLLAHTQLAWLRLSIMAVHPDSRGRGVGAGLLARAEEEAIRRGCLYAHVDTMSYQAPDFYLRCGYRVAGELPDWDSHGHAKLHFIKSLVSTGSAA